jgi:hypothetical protein
MTDLLPPARRSIPAQRRAQMRDQFNAEINAPTAATRSDSAIRRLGVPVIAAAAVAVIAVGGYLLAGSDDHNDGAPDPTGQGSVGISQDNTTPKHKGDQHVVPAGPSTAMADQDQAYQQCIDRAVRQLGLRDAPLTGRLAIHNDSGVTVVVANRTDSYTCNIKPDPLAVSPANELDGATQPSDFWFALNVTSNYIPHAKGLMVWAGGELPAGVSGVRYTFPDGHSEQAVVRDGFWAMQYFSEADFLIGGAHRVEVTLDGADAQTFELPFNVHTMCHQISHGC